MANPKMKFLWNHQVVDLKGQDKLAGAVVKNTQTGAESTLDVTGMFIAIGHVPNTGLFTGVLDMEDSGYLITRPGSTYTNIDGVFACGDVQDHTYRQAITAAGSGCMAAIDAERWLEAHH
jgi:thioredoxin reductase (NADPH)